MDTSEQPPVTTSRAPTGALRYTAFTDTPEGGNPAGVVLRADGMDDAAMLAVAAGLGYSETAFLHPAPSVDVPEGSARHYTVRYFSPRAEVTFCGHATIATAVAHAERHGPGRLVLHTRSGPVRVDTAATGDGRALATLTSVPPRVEPVDDDDLAAALSALRWSPHELDPALPPRAAFAGASHLVLVARTRERLARLDYDFPRLQARTARRNWTTVHLVPRVDPEVFAARDPFPPGGVVEDPATGAAAAAFGAYLHVMGAVEPPARVTVRQGEDMGRPSTLLVDVPVDLSEGVRVSGTAVPLP